MEPSCALLRSLPVACYQAGRSRGLSSFFKPRKEFSATSLEINPAVTSRTHSHEWMLLHFQGHLSRANSFKTRPACLCFLVMTCASPFPVPRSWAHYSIGSQTGFSLSVFKMGGITHRFGRLHTKRKMVQKECISPIKAQSGCFPPYNFQVTHQRQHFQKQKQNESDSLFAISETRSHHQTPSAAASDRWLRTTSSMRRPFTRSSSSK